MAFFKMCLAYNLQDASDCGGLIMTIIHHNRVFFLANQGFLLEVFIQPSSPTTTGRTASLVTAASSYSRQVDSATIPST